MDDPTRRDIMVAGASATALATTSALFAQQAAQVGPEPRFYEKGSVRIAWQEAGSGLPLLLIAGGGLNSRIAAFASMPLNPIRRSIDQYGPAIKARNSSQSHSEGAYHIHCSESSPIVTELFAGPLADALDS